MTDNRSNGRLIVSLFTLAGWIAITILGPGLFHPGAETLGELATRGVAWQILVAGAFLVTVILWRRWHDIGFRRPEPGTMKLLWLPGLIACLIFLWAILIGLPPVNVIFLLLLNTSLIGFSEETMFRGVLFRALRDRLRIWPAILVTTLAFGAVHILNVFVTGEFAAVLKQAVVAACSGLLLMALFLRTGSLWVAIFYHALWDWVTFMLILSSENLVNARASDATNAQGSLLTAAFPFLLVLPNVLYAIWLLRGVQNEAYRKARTSV